MAKKYIVRQNKKIKSEANKLRLRYETNLLECKTAFAIKVDELKQQKDKIAKSTYNKRLKELKIWYKEDKARIKKAYKNTLLASMKDNTLSLDKEQFDQHKAEEVFTTPNKVARAFKSLALTKNQKVIYKKLIKQQDKLINHKKSTFNPQNIFEAYDFNFWYGKDNQALFDINIKIKRNKVTAFIGPSGCGKSTFLKCLNRMHPTECFSTGSIYFKDGTNVMSKNLNVLSLRTRVGMIFQKPTPFPMSIYDNVAYGPRSHGITSKHLLDKIVQDSLKQAALWDEVKDKLFTMGTALSGGQQQRLCIARAIALKPEVLLMDESTSGLDPIATAKIENLMNELKQNYTIILVSHSMAQVQRVADYTAFFFKGELVEFGHTKDLFINPKHKRTKDYLIGKIS